MLLLWRSTFIYLLLPVLWRHCPVLYTEDGPHLVVARRDQGERGKPVRLACLGPVQPGSSHPEGGPLVVGPRRARGGRGKPVRLACLGPVQPGSSNPDGICNLVSWADGEVESTRLKTLYPLLAHGQT